MSKASFTFLGALFLSFCLSAAVSQNAFAQGAAVPSAPNPSFESVEANGIPTGWVFYSQKVYSLDDSTAKSGKRSLRWQNTDENFYALSKATLSGIPAGTAVKVTVSVKTQNVTGHGGSFCLEYWDENEKFLSGDYFSGACGTSDWHPVSLICEVPEECAKVTMCCFGASGATGTVWFDDIQIEPTRLPQIEAFVTDCYRNHTEGGIVKVYVGHKFRSLPEIAQKKSQLEILDASGKLLKKMEPVKAEDRTLLFTLDSTPLAPGKYTLKVSVPRTDSNDLDIETLTLTRHEKLPERKAWIDSHQRLILDGKPFFPMGLYTHNLEDEDIARFADSPFNCVISYHQLSRETMDKMYANGIRTIYSTGFWKEKPEEGITAVKEKIARLKDHPGIMAWYIFDEAPISFLPNLKRHREAVENADPSRPALAVTDKPEQIRGLLSAYDVIGTDPYPITRPWNLKLDASQAYEWTKSTHDSVWGTRAMWQVPQYFNWGIYNKLDIPPETFRRPTFEELRAMTWMCIAGGGNGIVGYSYYDIVHRFPKEPAVSDEEKKKAQEQHWAEVVKVMREVESRVPVLLSIEEPMQLTPCADSSEKIAHRLYGHEGKTWLLLVNTTAEPQTGLYQAPEGTALKILNAAELQEASVSVEKNALRAVLPPFIPVFIQLDKN